jgi:hypothetical protein
MSIQGESLSNGCGSSGSCKTSSAQIICVHVVPHFGGVLMMMSPGRSSKPSHRLLSKTVPSYRRTAVILAADSTPRAAADRQIWPLLARGERHHDQHLNCVGILLESLARW